MKNQLRSLLIEEAVEGGRYDVSTEKNVISKEFFIEDLPVGDPSFEGRFGTSSSHSHDIRRSLWLKVVEG